ncbi:sensor histidine kinase (plasmid) [Deinococcus taeanensis]|uniref:sensor histidine kinase n=1 Tax=Deinococcus taeanensis TaxID=2737050 RepID=UPI001CDD432C|nr:sensor histidine kinase [Deinococcus taeanensis]UBV44193.1 sensor histidine kinase [Deinococcus taeanensis]
MTQRDGPARRPGRTGRARWFWDLFPVLWLTFLAYPVQAFLDAPHLPHETAVFWGLNALFTGVFLRVFWGPPDPRWSVGGWALSAATYSLLFPLAPGGAGAYLIYGGSLIGFQPNTALAAWLAVLNVLLMLIPFWNGTYGQGDLGWLAPNLLLTLVAAYGSHGAYRQRVANAQLAQARAEQERLAAEAERERIARDLHDLLGHTLSVIVLKSELAGKLAGRDPARAAAEIREVERISREALTEVRAAVSGYQGSGLNAELARAKVALDASGVRLTVTSRIPALPPATETAAAMLLREAVTNVVRHAHAREVTVSLTPAGRGGWQLIIRDDGVGGSGPEGTGLTGMRERLRALGGSLHRDGRRGTTLTATLPPKRRDARAVPW